MMKLTALWIEMIRRIEMFVLYFSFVCRYNPHLWKSGNILSFSALSYIQYITITTPSDPETEARMLRVEAQEEQKLVLWIEDYLIFLFDRIKTNRSLWLLSTSVNVQTSTGLSRHLGNHQSWELVCL